MKKANIVLDDKSTGLTIIEKAAYEDADIVFDVLHDVFHPNGLGKDENPDPRFLALWTLFLHSVGWSEDEYWEEYNSRPRQCKDCGSLMDEDGNHLDEEILSSSGKIPSESKPN